MADHRGARGRAWLVELGVVFLGVLIALAADSWWEDRREAERELEYIQALVSDLAAASDTLEKTLAQAKDGVAFYSELLGLASSGAPMRGPSTPSAVAFPQVFLPTGTLDALLATGDVNLIQDEHLRSTIIREHAAIQDAKRSLDREQEFALSLRVGFFTRVRSSDADAGIFPDADQVLALARSDPEFNALLSASLASLGAYAALQEQLASSVAALRAAAERALEGR